MTTAPADERERQWSAARAEWLDYFGYDVFDENDAELEYRITGSTLGGVEPLIRERTTAGLTAARARGRVGGRKPSLTPKKVQVAQRMYDQGDSTVADIAKVLGVSRATIYRHLTKHAPHADGP